MKIGVTSQNFKTITGHAGKTRRFIVFEQNAEKCSEVERIDLSKEMSMHEFRGVQHPLDSLDVLITASCGEGFIRKMNARGVKVVATSESSPIDAVNSFITGQALPPPVPHHH